MNKKSFVITAIIIVTFFILTTKTKAEVTLEKPTANLTEKFNSDNGWQNGFFPSSNNVVAGWTNYNMMAMFFGATAYSMPTYQKINISGTPISSYGRFAGNYSKIDEITFDIQCSNSPIVIFYLKSTNSVIWKKQIQITTEEWENITVPLTQDDTWFYFIEANGAIPNFDIDKTCVSEIGFEIQRNMDLKYTMNHKANIDNVRLCGAWDKSTFINGMALAWLMENNLNETERDLDKDNDSSSNLSEFLAGTDPNDKSSVFRIYIEIQNDKSTLKWKRNKYAKYDLFGTDDLNKPFVPEIIDIATVPNTTNINVVIQEGVQSQKFYKVKVRYE